MRDHDIEPRRDRDRAMTERGGTGDWQGYVQPYRYYGPGYRGVGYYAVFYQGPDQGESRTESDQSSAPYGQGQDTGATWDDRHRWGMGSDRVESPGAWRERARQWGRFGQFSGRGPKGYQRSDERIREDVSDRFMEHPDLDASEIEVGVRDGVVTLTGDVESRWAKRLAEDIAEDVSGVRDVMNHLAVGGQYGPDQERADSRRASRGTTEATAERPARNGRRPVATNR